MKRLRKNTAKRQPDSTLPLINVVLLLVLVFMIAGTVASPLPADFTPLQTVAGEVRDTKVERTTITITAQGTILMAGNVLSEDDLRQVFKSAAATGGLVEIRTDARTLAHTVIRTMGLAKDADVSSVEIATLRRSE